MITIVDTKNRVNALIKVMRRIGYLLDTPAFTKAFTKASEIERAIVMLWIQNHDEASLKLFVSAQANFDLEAMTVSDLRGIASLRGVDYYAQKNKETLIKELRDVIG